jgi:hypothetical protein
VFFNRIISPRSSCYTFETRNRTRGLMEKRFLHLLLHSQTMPSSSDAQRAWSLWLDVRPLAYVDEVARRDGGQRCAGGTISEGRILCLTRSKCSKAEVMQMEDLRKEMMIRGGESHVIMV